MLTTSLRSFEARPMILFLKKMRHFLYSAVTVASRRFQYFPSKTTASGLLCWSQSSGDANWHKAVFRLSMTGKERCKKKETIQPGEIQ